MLASFPTFNNLNTVKYESECSGKNELSNGCRYLTGFTLHRSEAGNKVTEQDLELMVFVRLLSLCKWVIM